MRRLYHILHGLTGKCSIFEYSTCDSYTVTVSAALLTVRFTELNADKCNPQRFAIETPQSAIIFRFHCNARILCAGFYRRHIAMLRGLSRRTVADDAYGDKSVSSDGNNNCAVKGERSP